MTVGSCRDWPSTAIRIIPGERLLVMLLIECSWRRKRFRPRLTLLVVEGLYVGEGFRLGL